MTREPTVPTSRNESACTIPSSSLTPALSRLPTSRATGPGDLGEVGLHDAERRVGEPVGELAVVGQQQQALGVGVEASDVEEPGVAVGHEVGQRAAGPRGRSSC